MSISYYGGKSTIVPLPLNVFQKMIEDSYKADYVPNPSHVKRLFEFSEKLTKQCDDECKWYKQITEKALNWLD